MQPFLNYIYYNSYYPKVLINPLPVFCWAACVKFWLITAILLFWQ